MKELHLWLGKRGELTGEVASFLRYLEDTRAGRLSLVLRPEQAEGFDWVGDPRPREYECESAGMLTLYTSGTTGQPKASTKNVAALFERKRGRGGPTERWLLTYHPFRWAGISLITHVLRWGSQLVVPRSLELEEILKAAPRATHMSLTPSMFRKMMLAASETELSALPFEQLTFGGEAATQPVLDAARRLWPKARITHTYASTELGDICSVSDGLAGVPRAKFADFGFGPEGELLIEGRSTGDVWKLEGDRYQFVGRVEEVANVGGAKVYLASVDKTALEVAGVRQARAFAVPSALLGQMIALQYVGEIEPAELKKALRDRLPKISCPASVERVEAIELTQAGKVKRK
jgi:acyl-CoA synthetase (AMP-forming)/AMP-acid ligase II